MGEDGTRIGKEREEGGEQRPGDEEEERMCVHAAHVACQAGCQPPQPTLFSPFSLSLSLFSVRCEEGRRKGIFIELQPLTWSTPTNGPTCATMGTPQQVRDYRECAPKAVSCTAALYLFVCFFFLFFFFFVFFSFSFK